MRSLERKGPLHIWMIADPSSIHTARVANMLSEYGTRLTLTGIECRLHPELPEDVDFYPIPRPLIRIPKLGRLYVIYRLRRMWRKHRPDITHVHYISNEAWLSVMAGIRPMVVTCWGSDIHSTAEKNEAGLSRSRIRRVLRYADIVTADSELLLDEADEIAGGIAKKVTWRIGIDTDQFRPGLNTTQLRERIGLKQGNRVILSPRAMRPLMNHHIVLEAFAKVALRFPETVLIFKKYCMHFKEANDYHQRLERRAVELGVANRVLFLNDMPYEEMPLLYNLADVVVNVPDRDGMPMTLFEAMGCARPCVTASLRAYSALIDSFSQHLFTAKIEEDSIAHTIMKILEDKDYAGVVGENARKCAMELGDQRRETERLISAYKDLVGCSVT